MDYTKYLSRDTYAIFLFHGVIERQIWKIRNYTRKHIEIEYFNRVIDELRNAGNPVSMDEIVWHHTNQEELPESSFAVTFDDGYKNNLRAADILSGRDIPATFYVATEFIDKNTMAYIDHAEKMVESGSCDKEILDSRREFLKQPYWRTCPSAGDELTDKMTWGDLRLLNFDSRFTIGAHTHTHAILSRLRKRERDGEIFRPLWMLNNHGIYTHHFSYPEGGELDFDDDVIETLQSAGVVCCPTAIDGVNDLSTDLFHLKRVMVT